MRYVEVTELPKSNHRPEVPYRPKHNYVDDFECFMQMGVKIARVILEPDEFPDVRIAADNMSVASKKHGFPISVVRRNNEIYFVRRDI